MKKWKVVTCYLTSLSDVHPVQYTVGEWTEAPAGGLLVFNHFPEIYKHDPASRVFACEVEQKVDLPIKRIAGGDWKPLEQIQKFWSDPVNYAHNNRLSAYPWPEGTEAYLKVKLLEDFSK